MNITENKLKDVIGFYKGLPNYTSEIIYTLEQYEEYRLGLLARAPFQIGDRVELTETPDITSDNAPGWMHCRHFLVKGAKASVKTADFWKGKFRYGIVFDNESWLKTSDMRAGKLVTLDPPEVVPAEKWNSSIFTFSEDSLKHTDEEKPTRSAWFSCLRR